MVVRGRRNPFLPAIPEDDIDPALIDALPVVEPGQEAMPPWEQTPPSVLGDGHLASWPAPSELREILDALSSEMAASAASHMARAEAVLAAHVADLHARLAEADAHIEQLREENAALLRQKDAYERAFSTLRDLTRNVEDEAYR